MNLPPILQYIDQHARSNYSTGKLPSPSRQRIKLTNQVTELSALNVYVTAKEHWNQADI
jgi:hypothetical protein